MKNKFNQMQKLLKEYHTGKVDQEKVLIKNINKSDIIEVSGLTGRGNSKYINLWVHCHSNGITSREIKATNIYNAYLEVLKAEKELLKQKAYQEIFNTMIDTIGYESALINMKTILNLEENKKFFQGSLTIEGNKIIKKIDSSHLSI